MRTPRRNRLPHRRGLEARVFPPVLVSCSLRSLRDRSQAGQYEKRHELFERRFAVFEGTMRFLARASADGMPENEDVFEFRGRMNEAYFVFGADVYEYMDEIFQRVIELRRVQRKMKALEGRESTLQERQALTAQDQEHFKWISEQMRTGREKFGKYLGLW